MNEQILIDLLDDYLIDYAQACTGENPNLRWIDWLQGRIGGMLLVGRISGLLNPEASHLLQHACDHWYRYSIKEAA